MQRLAMGLAYDGSSWLGWQTQPHGHTVQDVLETALGRFAGLSERLSTICAGRTDTGVHAAMQVVHFEAPVTRRLVSWVRGVNAFLPPSIAVQWVQPVPATFHARFSAFSRTYVYLLWRGRVRPALWAGRVGWCFQPLDVQAMRTGAAALIGKHDFTSFRSTQCQAQHPVRSLYRLDIDERGPLIVFTLRANAFLHHMVRNIVGALLQIGRGKRPASWMTELLTARNRTQGAPTFAADGLYLSAIEYPTEFQLTDLDGSLQLLLPLIAS